MAASSTWTEAQAGARALGPRSYPGRLLAGYLMLADITVILVTSAAAYVMRHGVKTMPLEIASTTLLAVLVTLNAMRACGSYRDVAASSLWVQVGRAFKAWSIVIVILTSLAYVTKISTDFSRAWAIGWYVLALIGFSMARTLVAVRVRRWRERGKLVRTVAVVDLSGRGEALALRLVAGARGQMRVIGVFAEQPHPGRRNGIGDLVALSRLFRIDEVLVTVDAQAERELDPVLRRLGTIPTNVHLCPELPPSVLTVREVSLLYGQPVATVCHRPLLGWNYVLKRAEDLVLASVALVALSPLLVLIAILIKLGSKGPVLFRQRRLGFNNNVFTVLKFRSMTHEPEPDGMVQQAGRHDPRVTRIGRFLRRSSLDELPQLINVVRGEMSLVGPRPHALSHNDLYAAQIDHYLGRHRVQPGITGWAQVNGLRGETQTLDKMQLRVEYDLAYIDGWSFAWDIKILCLTVLRGAFHSNAY